MRIPCPCCGPRDLREFTYLGSEAYLDRPRWLRMSILNTAHSGHFSSDRTIAQYNEEIWKLTPIAPAPLGSQ